MNDREAYESLMAEGLSHNEAEAEMAAARKGEGQYLSWSYRTGYRIRFI